MPSAALYWHYRCSWESGFKTAMERAPGIYASALFRLGVEMIRFGFSYRGTKIHSRFEEAETKQHQPKQRKADLIWFP